MGNLAPDWDLHTDEGVREASQYENRMIHWHEVGTCVHHEGSCIYASNMSEIDEGVVGGGVCVFTYSSILAAPSWPSATKVG